MLDHIRVQQMELGRHYEPTRRPTQIKSNGLRPENKIHNSHSAPPSAFLFSLLGHNNIKPQPSKTLNSKLWGSKGLAKLIDPILSSSTLLGGNQLQVGQGHGIYT
ncbi:hypothetical protein ACOSP7_023546 [Xanthoceras sorbifolium]